MRIRTKLIAVFLATASVAFLSVLCVMVLSMRSDAVRNFEENSSQLLIRINDSITQFFISNMQVADYVSKNPLVMQAMGKVPTYVDTQKPTLVPRKDMTPEAQAVDMFLEGLLASHKEIDDIYIGFKDGTYLETPVNTWPAGHDPRKRPWYNPTITASAPVLVSNSYLTQQGVPVCAVNAKIRSASGELIGVLGLDIPLKGLVSKASGIKLGTTGYMMLIENTGLILADPKHPDVISKNIQSGVIPALKDLMRLNNSTIRATIDGSEKFVTVVNGYNNWKVVAVMDAAEVFAPTYTMLLNIFMVGSAAMLLLITMSLLLARNICHPINVVVEAANRIAGGDLKALPEHTNFSGEMGEMHRALQHMVSNLASSLSTAEAKSEEARQQTEKAKMALTAAEEAREAAENARRDGMLAAAERLESSTGVINKTSTELEDCVAQSEQGATRQAARIAETATAMEQMNSTVMEVARNAGTAADMTAQARTRAEEGAKLMDSMAQSMHKVEKDSLALKQDMGVLGQHAQSINQIMGVISDIADQTNLLALNAAIEAARAGDAGRGFAVVADEVRKLAEKTMASTTDVSNAIKAIQKSTEASIRQVDTAATNIAEATSLAGTAEQALTEIVGMVELAADQVRTIATAAEEQSASSEEINRSITEVSSIASNNAAIMKKAAEDVRILSRQANELDGLLSNMKQ